MPTFPFLVLELRLVKKQKFLARTEENWYFMLISGFAKGEKKVKTRIVFMQKRCKIRQSSIKGNVFRMQKMMQNRPKISAIEITFCDAERCRKI